MGQEIRTDLAVIKQNMGGEFTQFEVIERGRLRQLVTCSALALKHFFETGTYGDPALSTPDHLPKIWPFVRTLVYDALRPRFGQGESEFVTFHYSDKFVEDMVDEALAIVVDLPQDLVHKEWLFFCSVSGHMMMNDPFFTERGLVTEAGQEGFRGQSLMAGMVRMTEGDDMYRLYFNEWKKQFAIGQRVNSASR